MRISERIKNPKQLLQLFTPFGRGVRSDWQVVIILFLVTVALVIGWSVFLLNQINQGLLFNAREREKRVVDTVSRERLERIIAGYKERADSFEKARGNLGIPIDPSR